MKSDNLNNCICIKSELVILVKLSLLLYMALKPSNLYRKDIFLWRENNLLSELNVVEQIANVSNTTILKNAWKSDQEITIHGFIYNIHDGILKDLDVSISGLK